MVEIKREGKSTLSSPSMQRCRADLHFSRSRCLIPVSKEDH